MAFGRQDTDAVYDKMIAPVIRSEGLTPVRVDRREHNRNINDVIIEELHRSDLVLADLTYARPSVYFEAGFGERAGPVVYTVRADHLGGTDEFRVHFDVSMRNIVDWKSATDSRFAERLRRRMRHVLKPIRAKRKEIEERRAREAMFTSLPHRDQVDLLQRSAVDFLRSSGLTEEPDAKLPSTFHVRSGKLLWSTCIFAMDKWIRSNAFASYFASSFVPSNLAKLGRGTERVEHPVVFATLQAVPFSKVRSTFPNAHADAAAKSVLLSRTTTTKTQTVPARGRARAEPQEEIFVHVMDSLKSPEDLIGRVAEILPTLGGRARKTVPRT
jgi:nucleoside 2-deoxyribosyltransferase